MGEETPLRPFFPVQEEVRRMFQELIHQPWGGRGFSETSNWQPCVDMCETPEAIIVEVELPGVRREDVRIEVEGDAPATVVLRRFFFPAWQIGGPVAITPTVPLQLVSFVAPAGRHTFHLQRAVLPAEQWGWALSGLSLILLLVGSALSWRTRRP